MACRASKPCKLVDANLDFTVDLYHELSRQSADNIFYSPLSISIAFALVHLGAKGNTAVEMDRVMHYGKIESINTAFRDLDKSINGALHKSALHIANRLFGKQGFTFLEPYIKQSLDFYKAELLSLDFGGDPDGSRKVINDWVKSKTANKIKDLIPPNVINSLTALILVNAIYFKGEWANKFNESATYKGDFHVSGKKVVIVDMMKKKSTFPMMHEDELDAIVIELPYTDDNLSLFVLLPNQLVGLAKLESILTSQKLKAIFSEKLHATEIILNMPKFKFEQTIQLHEVLPTMGLKDVFGSKADLSGVDGGVNGLYLSKAIHKAFVEVNEEGTEAAAATAAIMKMRSVPRPPREIKVDHPFVFAIVEKKTCSALFMGRVANPEK